MLPEFGLSEIQPPLGVHCVLYSQSLLMRYICVGLDHIMVYLEGCLQGHPQLVYQ